MSVKKDSKGPIFSYTARGRRRWGCYYRDHRHRWVVKQGFERKAEAAAFRLKADAALNAWKTGRVGMAAAIDNYLEERLAEGKRESSYQYMHLWRDALGRREVASITPDLIRATLDSMVEENSWSPATRNRVLSQLSGVFTWAMKMRLIDRHPVRGFLGKQRESNARQRWLTTEELQRIEGASPPWLARIVRFGATTGMRLSEICNLRRADLIDHGEDVAFVVVSATKNRRVLRWPLTGPCLEDIRRRAPDMPHPGSYLFPGPRGGHAHSSIRRALRAAVEGAGLPWGREGDGITFHTLRHTMASLGRLAGLSTAELMTLGNWTDRRMVERYAHLADKARIEAAKTMARAASPGFYRDVTELEESETPPDSSKS